MSSQKIGSIKVPPFERANYNLWKKKMTLFIKAANPAYIGILENGPFVPMKIIPETVEDGVRIPQRSTPKEPTEYTDSDKEFIALDTGLQLIIVDSMDSEMSHQILNCTSGKHMWDTIELIMEGTEEVRENRVDILTSRYEAFKSNPGESITQVFERYNKLLNELVIQGKKYPQREINRKFMLTLPSHVEHKAQSIRERDDFNQMSLEKLYGKLKTYEMEQEQRAIIYGSGTVDSKNAALQKTTALVAAEPLEVESKALVAGSGRETIIEAETDVVAQGANEDDYYTLEELEDMEDKSMAYLASRFKHIKFRRNSKYPRSSANKFQKSSYSGSSSRSTGYKSNMVDRGKIRCFNCNELGHFATECKKPRQAKDKKVSYDKKSSYDELKKENDRLKSKLDAMVAKHQGKAYIAEGKSWDDSESDEDVEYGNFALMADSTEASPQSSQVTPTLTPTVMSSTAYEETIAELGFEVYNLHTSVLASEAENTKLVLKITKLESKIEELNLVALTVENLKQRNEYLENKVKCNEEIERSLNAKIAELELKVNAYKNSANIAKDIIDSQRTERKTAIGFDYSSLDKKKNKHVKTTFVSGGPLDSPERVDVPHVIKNSANPVFKPVIAEPINEEELIIKEQLRAEDKEKKVEVQEKVETLPSKSVSDENAKNELGSKSKKKKNNRNGKIGVNKNNPSTPTSSAPRKMCNHCQSTGHLTHACRKVKVDNVSPSMHDSFNMNNVHLPCGKVGCMQCAMYMMTACLTMMNTSFNASSNSNVKMQKPTVGKTASPPRARKETPISKPKGTPAKAKIETSSVPVEPISVKKEPVDTPVKVSKPPGPKQVWVPKKT